MSTPERLYTAALHAARPALALLAHGDGKLGRGVRGRRGVTWRMADWAVSHRDPARPLVWFHAPSVGEGLQARIVAEHLREMRPDLQIAYTYFSPSAERFASSFPADFADYLPLDLPAEVRRALDALRPAVIAFNKTEVWPNLSRLAVERGIRLALLSATLPAGAGRLRGIAGPLLRPTFARLHRVAAISAADAERFEALGVPVERRTVMGDAHFDRVHQRAAAVDPETSPLLHPLRDPERTTLVAGSTWPPDEARLLPAFAAARAESGPGAGPRLVLVPHEPTESHLRETERRIRAHGLRSVRLGELEGSGAGASARTRTDVLLVDRVGVLGDLYALADLAWVGGGFGSDGIHSVLEPASFGVPLLFGPRHANAREAAELVGTGAAWELDTDDSATDRLRTLFADRAARAAAGAAARAFVDSGLGAAERGVEIVSALLGRGDSAP
jgi:3-deoxy-D-manno-octulosonic-acid transferase